MTNYDDQSKNRTPGQGQQGDRTNTNQRPGQQQGDRTNTNQKPGQGQGGQGQYKDKNKDEKKW